jgi:hypothetical protein
MCPRQVALAGYVLGEFGVNICEKAGMSGYDQFAALQQHFANSSLKTEALLLTTYAKLVCTALFCTTLYCNVMF